MSLKKERLATIIAREVSDIIQFSLKDPNVGFVTITDVEVTGDLSIAKIYVTVFDKKKDSNVTIDALKRAKGFIRSELGKRLTVKKCPDLVFVLDTSLEKGNRIDELIKQTK